MNETSELCKRTLNEVLQPIIIGEQSLDNNLPAHVRHNVGNLINSANASLVKLNSISDQLKTWNVKFDLNPRPGLAFGVSRINQRFQYQKLDLNPPCGHFDFVESHEAALWGTRTQAMTTDVVHFIECKGALRRARMDWCMVCGIPWTVMSVLTRYTSDEVSKIVNYSGVVFFANEEADSVYSFCNYLHEHGATAEYNIHYQSPIGGVFAYPQLNGPIGQDPLEQELRRMILGDLDITLCSCQKGLLERQNTPVIVDPKSDDEDLTDGCADALAEAFIAAMTGTTEAIV